MDNWKNNQLIGIYYFATYFLDEYTKQLPGNIF